MTKICIVAFLAFAVLQVARPQEEEATFCLQKTNYERSKLKEVAADDSKTFPENDEDFNRFVECFFKKRNFLKENGEVDYATLVITLVAKFGTKHETEDKKIEKQVMEFCKDTPAGSSVGQTGIKAYNCANQKIQELVKKHKSE